VCKRSSRDWCAMTTRHVTVAASFGARPVLDLDTTVPVVVLQLVTNPFHHGTLGIVRSLGRLGVAVHAFCDDRWTPGAWSRFSRSAVITRPNQRGADDVLKRLLGLSDRLGRRPVLIPTDDLAALLVEEHADVLKPAFRFPDQPRGLADTLSSKKELYLLCKRFGIPTPEVAFPRSRDDVLQFIDGTLFPVVVKSIDARLLRQRPGAKSVLVAHNARELIDAYDHMEVVESPNLLLQEYIPGSAETIWMFDGYFDYDSACLASFTGHKIRQYPPYTGVTTLGICLPNPGVERMTHELMQTVGYRGIVDMGYRYDARDGQYKLLDVNPRIGGTFRLFVGMEGMDVVRALYLDLTGQRVPLAAPRWGRKWLVENYDVPSSIRYMRDGRLTLSQWVRSFQRVEEAAWFARDDPLPFAVMGARFGLSALKKLRPTPLRTR
ncbi:MAG: carboxylate--amine ligase, partial [Chloroflexota bacterium]